MKAVFARRTRKGQAVLLGEGGHCLAAYHCDGPRVSLENIETVDTRNLRDVCRRPPGVSALYLRERASAGLLRKAGLTSKTSLPPGARTRKASVKTARLSPRSRIHCKPL